MFRIFYLCVENGDCAHLVCKPPISHIIFFLKCIRRKQTNRYIAQYTYAPFYIHIEDTQKCSWLLLW